MPRLWDVLTALALVASTCGGSAPTQLEPAEGDGELSAVATVFPLAWIAEQIAPGIELTFLGQRGQEPHGLELSPSERVALQNADVVLYMGDIGFQPQVEEAIKPGGEGVVAVAQVIGDEALRAGEAHAHEGEGGEEHAGEAEGGDGAIDPHVWFDPSLMASVTEQIGEAFAAANPDETAFYQANAAEVASQLAALDAEIDQMLSNCTFDEAIVSHEAYAYLLAPHGLSQHGISGVNPEAGASPGELAELAREIQEEGLPAVLAEPFEGRAAAEALAQEAGVELLEINPLEVVAEDQFQTGYPELLRQQAATFATALGCAGARGSGVGNPEGQGSGVGNPEGQGSGVGNPGGQSRG